jgi:hypothetical protein
MKNYLKPLVGNTPGSWRHIWLRLQERLPEEEKEIALKAIQKLTKILASETPKFRWYFTIKNKKKETIGYVVGKKNFVTTILGSEMIPSGKEI